MGPHAVAGPYPHRLLTPPLPLGSGGRLALAGLPLGVPALLSGRAAMRLGGIKKASRPVDLAPEQDGPPEGFVPRHSPILSARALAVFT